MSISVKTPYGTFDFEEADEFALDPEDGRLDVLKDGNRIAIFNTGDWQFAEVVADLEETADQEVWESVFDIPPRTLVTDNSGKQLFIIKDGDGWNINERFPLDAALVRDSGWTLDQSDNDRAPFTKVSSH